MNDRRMLAMGAIVAAMALVSGCGAPVAEFRRYETYRLLQEKSLGINPATDKPYEFDAAQRKDVDDILAALFGTPDEPALPQLPDVDVAEVADLRLLTLAAGPVGSDETGRPTGLYREHCAHCHGITGDGNGPTAIFLNPYPRDYRPGKFKFKSTPIGQRPTHDDLKKIVVDGIPGTAMPSFRLLPEQEIEALVHYVKYLSLRGEMERKLYETLAQLEEEERLFDPTQQTDEGKAKQKEQLDTIVGLMTEIVGQWQTAPESVTEIETRPEMTPEQLEESRKIGQRLYYGALANCFSCHGPSALGDGQTTDYDGWVTEFVKSKPPKPEEFYEWVELGMLPPRNVRPRNLRQGVFRGGLRPIDIYWRIRNGIEGTPMPGNDKLKPEEIWHLVNYVQSLPYESISDPRQSDPEYLRERM
jgi:mono/diheme cytochrome c family protein